jgi:G protein-coupled receptor 158
MTCYVGQVKSEDSYAGEVLDNGSGDGDEDHQSEDMFGGDSDGDRESVRDVVDEFLSIVERYERNRENCTPGVTFHLGEGVITQYGVIRFRQQAEIAVNRANFLTRIWKGVPQNMLESEYFFYTQVRSMLEGSDDLFAAGNCYDYMEFNNYTLFCPYAYRLPNDTGSIMVKDLSVEYKYLGNESEFFIIPRQKAEEKLSTRYNETIGECTFVS